ncbi:MAG TPA: hypothetical protein VII39_06055 [Bradyrhizobium sp.]|jgi:hypothetical protein
MRISSLAVLAAVVAVPVSAPEITDAVPGHPGVTYASLLKAAVPGLTKDKDGNWTASAEMRGFDGKTTGTDLAFNSIEALTVKEHGRNRLILLTGDSQTGDSFSAVLAAYDDTARRPKLLDVMDAGGDRFVGFSEPRTLAIALDTDAFIVNVNHFNSNQNYTDETIYYLDGGKLKVALANFTLNEGACGYEMRQVPVYKVREDKGARFNAIAVSVTQTTTLNGEECDAGTKLPKAGSVTYTDIFRFDAKKNDYVAQSDTLSKLVKPDQ